MHAFSTGLAGKRFLSTGVHGTVTLFGLWRSELGYTASPCISAITRLFQPLSRTRQLVSSGLGILQTRRECKPNMFSGCDVVPRW